MAYIFTKRFGAKKGSTKLKKRFKALGSATGNKWPGGSWWKNLPWKKIGIIAGIVVLIGALSVVGVFAYFARDLPSPGKVNTRVVVESTKILDRTGEHLLYEIHGEEKRTLIPFSEMPDNIKFATLVLEDQDFYHHHGIKLSSIVRAALRNFVNVERAEGGSTITQQFVKNSLLTREKTYTRKIKEVILSLEIERKFSKDEILEMYLNEIPYGSNAYGIEAAAQTFFNKNARDLTLDEAALLAALPKAPSYFSPFGSHVEELKARQELAIQRLADLGYISAEDAQRSKAIDVFEKIQPRIENIEAPHFVMYVKEYLEEKYGKEAVEQGGLNVITTLDWEKQKLAERVVKEGAERNLTNWNAENASLIAIDPRTGQLLTMVGSKDFFDQDIDGQVNVAIRDRQPGSSIKPFVYLAAFTKGYTPETMLFDVQTDFEAGQGQEDYEPQNYDGKFRGPVKIKEALGQSLNIPAVKTLYLVGVKDAVAFSKSLGITTLNNPERYGLSLVLGGGEVKLLDHTLSYATLANSGVRQEKTAILQIRDNDGNVLEEFSSTEGTRVVEEEYVAMLDSIISNNDLRAPAFGSQNPLRFDDRQVAAKTGTTNEYRDGWTMGYTPNLAVGVWAGNNDNRPMRPGAAGANVAGPIFNAFMSEAVKNLDKETFPTYDEEEFKREKDMLNGELKIEEDVKVCEIPGDDDNYCLSNKYCRDDDEKKMDFADVHTILHYVDIRDPLGDAPERPENDPQYKKWEKAVREYYEDEDDYFFGEIPEDECKEDDFSRYKPSISLSLPSSTSNKTFTISVSSDAPYGIDKIEVFVEGDRIAQTDDDSIKIDYSVPESQNNKTLTVEAKLEDEIGNEISEKYDIDVSY